MKRLTACFSLLYSHEESLEIMPISLLLCMCGSVDVCASENWNAVAGDNSLNF